MVEHHLAMVGVAGSSPVFRSKTIFKDIHYIDKCGVSKGIDRLIYRILIAQDAEYLRCIDITSR